MSGKSPICDQGLIDALSVTFEPCFPMSVVRAGNNPSVQYLSDQGVLKKNYEKKSYATNASRTVRSRLRPMALKDSTSARQATSNRLFCWRRKTVDHTVSIFRPSASALPNRMDSSRGLIRKPLAAPFTLWPGVEVWTGVSLLSTVWLSMRKRYLHLFLH